VGYWDPEIAVKTNNKNVLASTYIKKGEVMIAMGNWADKDQSVKLDIDWNKLGLNSSTVKIEAPEIDKLQTQSEVEINNLIIPASKGLILIVKE
jgi:hypothetical protein